LPGIDDGAKTLEESMVLLEGLSNAGITKLITTPHIYGSVWPNNPQIIKEKYDQLQQEITNKDLPYRMRYAAEYMLDEKFSLFLNNAKLLTIKNNYILIEFPNFQAPLNLHDMLFKLNTMGYEPVLAHPERYAYFNDILKQTAELKEIGCSFQLNLLSLANHYGQGVYKNAMTLLTEGLIDFVGTDAHRMYHIQTLAKIASKKHLQLLEIPFQNNMDLW